MWLFRAIRHKILTTFRILWIFLISCFTILLMVIAIIQFRDECFHAPFPPSEQHINRCGTVLLKNEGIVLSNNYYTNTEKLPILSSPQVTEQTRMPEALGKSNHDHEEALEYFSSRRNSTKLACLAMFWQEDESQNRLVFDNDDDATTKSNPVVHEKSESKFFMRATNPTRWIFYKHNSTQIEIQWCPLYKSGSSSWMAVFSKLSGALSEITESKLRSGSITFQNLANNFRMLHSSNYANLAREDTVQIFTMVVTRHPFQRLLSAYRDKLERIKGREYYNLNYGRKIIRRFRRGKKYIQKIDSTYYDESISVTDLQSKNRRKNNLNPNAPTFEEFCQYLISVNPTVMNEHWRPQFLDCSPCHHNFDLILKLEDMKNDKLQVFKILGINNETSEEHQEIDNIWKRWTNRNYDNNTNYDESYYFSQLSESLLKQLYELYEPDFELFGYSPDDYFRMTKM